MHDMNMRYTMRVINRKCTYDGSR